MLTAGRFVIILIVCGAIAHILFGGGLSFWTDYRIWAPAVQSSRQEIILAHDVNGNDEKRTISSGSGPSDLNSNSEIVSNKLASEVDTSTEDPMGGTVGNKPEVFTSTENPIGLLTRPSTQNRSSPDAPTRTSEVVDLFNNETILMPTTVSGLRMIPQSAELEDCPLRPPNLVGPIKVWLDQPSYEEIERIYPYLEFGGHGKPAKCLARHRVAIIVPYRDRDAHLRVLLHNLHSLLTKQQLDYAIFIVEQYANETFNRAKLMNVGYAEAMKLYDWQCFIFHDVDLLPEDDRNIYSCPEQPRHMSVAIDKFQYKLPYGAIFGGIGAMKTEQFLKVNGFSNDYWGWGGEDDDFSTRVTSAGYKIIRYSSKIARYKMIKHGSEKNNPPNTCRYDLMNKTNERQYTDGISSLKYERYDLQLRPLFTHIKVKLLEEESKERLRKEGFKEC